MSWSYIIRHMIDLTRSGQFYIIIHLEIDLSLIICYPTYLIFLANLYNQTFELTFSINLYWIGGVIGL